MPLLDEGGSVTEARCGLPRLGEPAPAFEAVTTHGTVRLADYAGSWLVLFSHPADFTLACTTEFIGFAKIYPRLRDRQAELLGLSIDSVCSRIAWVRTSRRRPAWRSRSRSPPTWTEGSPPPAGW
jgi:peroxiredoxin (alkyl hydroperoxide reductase subunit C)